MRATIKSIAELSGTSKSTVDRALKGLPGVNQETRQRILEIAEQCGYRTNVAGRALRRQCSPVRIAVVFRWQLFEKQIREGLLAAQNEFYDLGIRLEFFDLQTTDCEEQYHLLQSLCTSGIQGVVLKPVDHPRIVEAINALESHGIPVVTISSDLPQSNRFRFIGQNYYQAGRVAGSLMNTALGGKGRVAIFQESNSYHAYTERGKGFQEVLVEKYSSIAVDHIECKGEGIPENYNQALQYFSETGRPDGVFCTGISYPMIAQAALDSGNPQIRIIGYDIFDGSMPLIEQDVVDFIITQNPYREGHEGVRTLFQYLISNVKEQSPMYYTPLNICNKESLFGTDKNTLIRL